MKKNGNNNNRNRNGNRNNNNRNNVNINLREYKKLLKPIRNSNKFRKMNRIGKTLLFNMIREDETFLKS
jgi:hypothetical protein